MAISDTLAPVGNIIGGGISNIARYKYLLLGIVIVVSLFALIYFISVARKKKKQWTHKFIVQRVLSDGSLSQIVIHKARRFPLEHGVEVFELEKPLLGCYLIPQPGEYSDVNSFSIILDKNNRIWINKGTKFNKEKQSSEVSAVHAGIDVEMQSMKEKWQQAHKVKERITTTELIKAGLKALAIIAITIILIVAIGAWGESRERVAEKAVNEAVAMEHLAQAMKSIESTVNTQQLMIIPMLKALYDTENIAAIINKYKDDLDEI